MKKIACLTVLCSLLFVFGCNSQRSDSIPTQSLPDTGKSTSEGNKTKLEALRTERDAAKKKRIEAEDWLKRAARLEKNLEEKKQNEKMNKHAPFVDDPLWSSFQQYPEHVRGLTEQAERDKTEAERTIEALEDKIRDLTN